MEPIDWIGGVPPKTPAFWDGVPFVGTQSRVVWHAKSLLRKRHPDFVEKSWVEHGEKISAGNREKALSIAQAYMGWPNTLFIPEDRAAIVFGFIPGIWIEPVDVLAGIAELYGVDWIDPTDLVANLKEKANTKKKRCVEIYESAQNDTLIGFFKNLEDG